jgi:hypothetical protein
MTGAADFDSGEDILVARPLRRNVLSLLCCLAFLAVGTLLLVLASNVLTRLTGVFFLVFFGLVALYRCSELWRRSRWLIKGDRVQCLIGKDTLVVDLPFDGLAAVELVDLRPPEARKGVRVPLTARPVLGLLSAALGTNFLCLGLRLVEPAAFDQKGPRWAAQRGQVRRQHGVDVLIPLAKKPEDARDLLEIVRGRAGISPGAGR